MYKRQDVDEEYEEYEDFEDYKEAQALEEAEAGETAEAVSYTHLLSWRAHPALPRAEETV